MRSTVPRLEGLEITILVDNEVVPGGYTKGGGFSTWIRVKYPKKDLNLLFDTAAAEDKLLENARKSGLDPKKLDYVVLSHKHRDHTGGLLKVLEGRGSWTQILHGQGIFRPSIAIDPFLRHTATLPFLRGKIEAKGAIFTPVLSPLEFAPGLHIVGPIPLRSDFEVPPYKYAIPGTMEPDHIQEEVSLVASLPDGIAVFSGCSHRGIYNIVGRSMEVTGRNEVRAIIGGLHLAPASERRVGRTIESLAETEVGGFYIGHCTGKGAIQAFQREFGEAVVRTKSGLRFEL